MRTRAWAFLVVAGLALAAASFLAGVLDPRDPELWRTVLELRGARLGVAMLAGAALSVGGVLVQSLFRNPLADPSILGTTAGATLGAEVVLVAGELGLVQGALRYPTPEMLAPWGALIGALTSLALLLGILRWARSSLAILLVGFVMSSFCMSVSSFVTSLAQEHWELGRAVFGFALGGLAGSGTRHVALALPLVLSALVAAWLWGPTLDVLLSGEEEAASLGVDLDVARRWCAVWVAVLTAAAIAVGGAAGFVGLIVPHIARRYAGPSHRGLIPMAAVGGSVFVVGCDVVARIVPTTSEVPLGVVTGLVGAPVFVFLLLRARKELSF